MDHDNAVEVTDLSLRFGSNTVLAGLSLRAEPSQITTILGPNGAGKTTLVRCCTGVLTPDSGSINLAGTTPARAAATGLIGVMPQSSGAWSGIRTRELLAYLATLYAHPHRLDDLARWFGLQSVWNTPYRRLSGGQQQAVNFAAALIGRPAILLLDEPTAGMDPHARRHTWHLMDQLRQAAVTIVVTTHSMEEATELADQVWIMDAGKVAIHGSVSELTAESTLEEVYLRHTTSAAQGLAVDPARETP